MCSGVWFSLVYCSKSSCEAYFCLTPFYLQWSWPREGKNRKDFLRIDTKDLFTDSRYSSRGLTSAKTAERTIAVFPKGPDTETTNVTSLCVRRRKTSCVLTTELTFPLSLCLSILKSRVVRRTETCLPKSFITLTLHDYFAS